MVLQAWIRQDLFLLEGGRMCYFKFALQLYDIIAIDKTCVSDREDYSLEIL